MFINGEELSQQISTQELRITDSLPQVLDQQYLQLNIKTKDTIDLQRWQNERVMENAWSNHTEIKKILKIYADRKDFSGKYPVSYGAFIWKALFLLKSVVM